MENQEAVQQRTKVVMTFTEVGGHVQVDAEVYNARDGSNAKALYDRVTAFIDHIAKKQTEYIDGQALPSEEPKEPKEPKIAVPNGVIYVPH